MNRLTTTLIAYLARVVLATLLAFTMSKPVLALGTSAGINISNTARVDYVVAGSSGTASDTVSFRVDEKLDVNVSWQDAANVVVATPDSNQVLTYLLSNTGNGTDSYTLTVQNTLGGDQFNPVFVDIYLDSNGNGIFNPGVDTLYNPGFNDPVLAADTALAIFVRNNIPPGRTVGDLGNSQLMATSNTGSGLPGTAFAGLGDGGGTAVVGTSGGSGNDIGTYEVANTTVNLVKSVVISDPLGGSQPVTGATLTYSIVVTAAGPGTATNVVITDALPANTTYSAGTLTLNAAALTDAVDADAGDVAGTTPNTVTVNLGDLTPASPVQTITFETIIN
jgi:uncharacterized repeat protein (TIGR01451 family)